MFVQASGRLTRRVVGVLAASCFVALSAGAQTPALPTVTIPDRPDNSNKPRDPVRLIGNIYWVGHSQVGSFLFKTSQGYILMDPTSTENWPWVKNNLDKLAVKPSDVKILLNLHTHEEHMGGMSKMKELTGATLYLSKASADEVATGGRTDFREDGSEQYTPFKADKILDEGSKVTLGETTLTAHLTPGHSRGCTSFTTTVQEDGRAYDVVFVCGMATPGVDRSVLLDNPKYPNVALDYAHSFEKLRKLKGDVWFYPRATTIRLDEKLARMAKGEKPNPFVDPVGWQWYLDSYEYEFTDQLAQQLRLRAAKAELKLKELSK